MQANNKNDMAQVYEGATRATKVSIKDAFKYLLKPLTIFSYHYFIEGIKAVQNDGQTKELEKLTNLSYDETIRIMEKCQKDGVRIVASERNLHSQDSNFGKKKSLYRQKRITRYSRKIKKLSNLKVNYPQLERLLRLDKLIKINEIKQSEQVKEHKNKFYNIYFNKSKTAYFGDRIADIIEYRTGISQKLFDKDTQMAIEQIKNNGMNLNTQQLKDLSDKLRIHEIGNIEIEQFKKDYCIHEIPFKAFMNIKDDLEVSDIQYGVKVITNDENQQFANIYFENKDLDRYNELGINSIGQIHVYGSDNKNIQWSLQSQDEIVSFKTKTGEQEKQTYSILSGKNYVMKREENECLWTVFRKDLKELAEKEKKRNVVDEELEQLKVFEQLEKESNELSIVTNNTREIKVEFNDDIEKEVGG